jgi:flagellar biosynthetic protein FliQ
MHQLTSIIQQALFLVLVVSAPPVLMSLLVGFIIALFQATTQIQEQTLTFAPKMVAVFGILAIMGGGLAASWCASPSTSSISSPCSSLDERL